MKEIIQHYLNALGTGDLGKIIQLFSDDAIIHSPLYGDVLAKIFFTDLFADTSQSEISLLNTFTNLEKPGLFAAHFRYFWILKNGAETSFECIDIFQFDEQGKIKEMTIIYDTWHIRDGFKGLA